MLAGGCACPLVAQYGERRLCRHATRWKRAYRKGGGSLREQAPSSPRSYAKCAARLSRSAWRRSELRRARSAYSILPLMTPLSAQAGPQTYAPRPEAFPVVSMATPPSEVRTRRTRVRFASRSPHTTQRLWGTCFPRDVAPPLVLPVVMATPAARGWAGWAERRRSGPSWPCGCRPAGRRGPCGHGRPRGTPGCPRRSGSPSGWVPAAAPQPPAAPST